MRALKIGFVLELVVLACTGLIALCVSGLAYLHAPALVAMPLLVIFALELLVLPLLAILPARHEILCVSAFPEIVSAAFSLTFRAVLPSIGLSLKGVS